MQIPSSPPFLAVFTVYSWRVVFAYYRVLACNGGVELDSDASGYGADALNGGSGQGCNSINIYLGFRKGVGNKF